MTVHSTQTPRPVPTAQKPHGKLPRYLHRRGNIYYFKRKVPADARSAFPGQGEQLWKALGTPLLQKALVMHAVEVSEFEFTLARFRREQATKTAGVGPRIDARQPVSTLDNGAGLEQAAPDCDRSELVRLLELSLERLRTPSTATERKPAATTLSPKGVVAKTESSAAPGQSPSVPPIAARGNIKMTMLHLLEDWKQQQTRHRTVNAVTTTVHEFRDLHGSIPVEDITRKHVRDYRDQLIERRLSRGTVENRIGFLSTLVRHGMREIVEELPSNPFARIDLSAAVGARPAKNRRAYQVKELNVLYSSALYTQGLRPTGQAVEAAYWTPLLGPFIGARLEELCQLQVEDIQRINGSWCLRLCDLDPEQKIKNDGSFRRVPLHDSVIQCGFLVYVVDADRKLTHL